MKRTLKIAGVVAAILFTVLSILVAAWLGLRKDWIEPIEGVRLEPLRPVLKAEDVDPDGAFDLLTRATGALPRLGLDLKQEMNLLLTTGTASSDLLAVLANSDEALRLARLTAAKEGGQVPTATDPGFPLPYLAGTKSLAQLLAASAALKAWKGDEMSAIGDLVSAIRLGQIASRGGVIMNHLVDIACTEQTCRTLRIMAARHPLSPGASRAAQEALKRADDGFEPLPEVLRFERLMSSNIGLGTMMMPQGHPWWFGRTLTQDTRRDLDRCWAHLIRIAEAPYDPNAYPAFEARFAGGGSWTVLLKKDPAGFVLAGLLMPAVGKTETSHLRCLATLRATRTVLAVRQFQARTGKPPAALNELVKAGDLPGVPEDPFDRKPLRYKVKPDGSWVVYSVGPNLIDDGGMAGSANPMTGDLIYPSDE